jgi:hypothetical protein
VSHAAGVDDRDVRTMIMRALQMAGAEQGFANVVCVRVRDLAA